jgi:hypothetical protein
MRAVPSCQIREISFPSEAIICFDYNCLPCAKWTILLVIVNNSPMAFLTKMVHSKRLAGESMNRISIRSFPAGWIRMQKCIAFDNRRKDDTSWMSYFRCHFLSGSSELGAVWLAGLPSAESESHSSLLMLRIIE